MAATNAGRSSEVQSDHIRPALSTSKKAVPAARRIAKKVVISLSAKQMVTRSMASPNSPRVTWSKDGRKSEVLMNNTNATSPSSQKNNPVIKGLAKTKENFCPVSTRITKTVSKSMDKTSDAARKTPRRPSARVRGVGRSEKDPILLAPGRHSVRLAERLSKSIIITPARITTLTSSVPPVHEAAIEVIEAEGLSTLRTSSEASPEHHSLTVNNVPACSITEPSGPIYDVQSNNQSRSLESAVGPGIEAGDEETMAQYIMRVNNRIDALEYRELLRATIAAPFWWEELSRDLQKQVVRLSIAISSGRVRDFNEVFQYPIEHSFWTEEVHYNMDVSRAA
jgi:hypothetical protein